MSIYVKLLFFVIPLFMAFIVIENIVARRKGLKVNRHEDMISSLSSGMTNIMHSVIKFGVVIISYSWLVEKITIFKVEPIWLAVLIAFIVEDFAGYWMHRMHHRVNLFWNRHVIHHSSEEFNLSCALRQSISTTFRFSAILMIPAALMGIPSSIFAVLGPIHLFMQFWYHTRTIDKMGFLEHILVTPSHHRVHHAINPEYLDKNYSQIFIIWDKLFNTFQVELDDVKPVYGVLRPVSTWNPVIINFKHVWQLIKDAWHTEKLLDKIQIWFRPTGWRPEDVKRKFPLNEVRNPYSQKKYDTRNSTQLIVWAWIQFGITQFMIIHFFIITGSLDTVSNYSYACFIMINIFSFTTLIDKHSYVYFSEMVKLIALIFILVYQNFSWFNLEGIYVFSIIGYFALSIMGALYFNLKKTEHRIA